MAEISPSQSTTHHDVATSSGLCDTQTHRFSRHQNVEDDSICVSVVSDSLSLHLSPFIQHKHLSNLSRDHASLQRSGTWGVVQQEFHPTCGYNRGCLKASWGFAFSLPWPQQHMWADLLPHPSKDSPTWCTVTALWRGIIRSSLTTTTQNTRVPLVWPWPQRPLIDG